MLKEIMINLLYIVAILGLLSLAYCIIVGIIETQIDRKKRKAREQELDKMLEDFTNNLIKELTKEEKKKDTKKK